MKELKYLKLYEAFESIKLSKTLGFINKDAKRTFLNQLKQLADKIDLPYSKYSDDYFQYLPFKKALDLNMTVEDQPCDATSRAEFPDYAVEGESCQKGKLKRKWGNNVRAVVCPVCKGTGVKPKRLKDIKWIKFWFDKEGKYVSATGTDGQIRDQYGSNMVSIPNLAHIITTSQELSDYNVHSEIRRASEFFNYPTGTYVHLRIDGKTLIGRIFKEDRNVFIIQNRAAGSTPNNSDDWRSYGNQSWHVSNGDYSGTPKVLIPKNIDTGDDDGVEDEKVDPYTWNAPIEIRNLSLSNAANVKSILSDAHFAIVLDYLELKKSGFKTKQSISTEREESRAGATSLMTDEEIKSANINRYMDELAKKVKIEPDLANISNLVFRYFGLGKFGYYVLRGRHFTDFNSILSYLYKFLKEEDKEYYYNQIIENIKYKSKINSEFNVDSEAILKKCFDKTSSEKKKLKSKLEELNSVIYNRFKSFEIENIDDLDLFYNKMLSLRRIWKESDRFPYTKKIYYLVENMSDEYRTERYLNDIDDSQVTNIIEEMDRFINLSKKI
jgi:hypothetical protein